MDEADALVSSRGTGEHEASRRLKTEFLTSMDGISSVSSDTAQVMLLAATNTPWDLDDAIIRRLEKRIHIPLPDLAARCELFAINLREVDVEGEVQIPVLATATEGYSGADIHLVCREASMVSRNDAFAIDKTVRLDEHARSPQMPMRRIILGKSPVEIQAMRATGQLASSTVTMEDFKRAIENVRPSLSEDDLRRHAQWEAAYGSQ